MCWHCDGRWALHPVASFSSLHLRPFSRGERTEHFHASCHRAVLSLLVTTSVDDWRKSGELCQVGGGKRLKSSVAAQ
jgi:hypothetical protein